ncbi:MAG: TatD family deoxyribonuclease [Candidatus Aenigmarchaeota archaeon]|nr:TatD family deoxyribonuclease [Candidatus Aenigmarchaeota archaeon]
MIDCHTHLESPEYNPDRDAVIESCRSAGLKAIVTCCANPKDWELTKEIVAKHRGFVFASASVHPQYVKELPEADINNFMDVIRKNSGSIVAVGETGLDFNYIKEPDWREKQAELFRKFIALSNELDRPLVIHARDAYEEVVEILEQEGAKRVMLHMFGANQLVKRVIDNGWSVSMNAIVMKSKKHTKVTRDMPLNRLMLETDAPWLRPDGKGRNDPRSIRQVAERIAEIKKLKSDEVWDACAKNAINFFKLPIRLSTHPFRTLQTGPP